MTKKLSLILVVFLLAASMFSAPVYSAGVIHMHDGDDLQISTGLLTDKHGVSSSYDMSGSTYIVVDDYAQVSISGTGNVQVNCQTGVELTIANATINGNGLGSGIGFTGINNTLILLGASTVTSSPGYAGIYVSPAASLTIQSDYSGSVTATGGSNAAGIGGNTHCGDITINSGTVIANGSTNSAGIGGGNNGGISSITINGGNVTATGGANGAGIGSGNGYFTDNITITNGIVTATGGTGGAGIGGGYTGECGILSISGGTITAQGGSDAAGIGAGADADSGGNTINISGGDITATGGANGAGIGAGSNCYIGALNISGGIVEANGGTRATALGAGADLSSPTYSWTVVITGGEVYADGDTASGAQDVGKSVSGSLTRVTLSGNGALFTKENPTVYSTTPTTTTHVLKSNEAISGNSAYGYSNIPAAWSGTAYAYVLDTDMLISAGGTYDITSIPSTVKTISISTTSPVTIKDTSGSTKHLEIIGQVAEVDLTIEDLDINASSIIDGCALSFTGNNNTLTLVGNSYFTSWGLAGVGGEAGILVGPSTGLMITSNTEGSVTATGGTYGAGIGGGFNTAAGAIIVDGNATVYANGTTGGAGIGGGNGVYGNGGTVILMGGTIYANGERDLGAGVNYNGALGDVVIMKEAAVFLKNNTSYPGIINPNHTIYDESDALHISELGMNANGWTTYTAYLRPTKLQYSLNSGTGSSKESIIMQMGKGTVVDNTSGITRDGYILGDWNTKSDGTGASYAPGDTIILSENLADIADEITLYAEWTPIAVTGVSLSSSSETLVLGDLSTANDAVTLTATVSPSDAANKSVSWFSSDSTVASVSDGVVTAHKAGSATITVATTDGNHQDTCSITVEQKVTGVSLNSASETLILGDGNTANNSVTLTATVSPDDADDKTVSWSSSDSTVASVSDGVVTAKKAGTATITVTTTDGNKQDTCTITVEQKVSGVTLSSSSETLILGDGNTANNSVTLTATVSPDDADDQTVSWKSSDSTVASVSDGVVTAHKAGSATITVTTTDGNHEDTCSITVEQKVSGVSLNSSSETLILGDNNTANNSVTLTATVSPDDANDQTVSWKSSDSTVASVSDGVVTAHKAGSATITVTTTDGNHQDTCSITVEQKVTGVSLSSNSETLVFGDVDPNNNSVILTATVSPNDSDNQAIIWTIDNPIVADITPLDATTCLVYANDVGYANVTVTTADGSFTDVCQVLVKDDSVYPVRKSGSLTGNMTNSGTTPQSNRKVILFSDPVITTTDADGNFSFSNVDYTLHTLILNDQSGAEFDRYTLNFVSRTTNGYSQSGNIITIFYTDNTLGVDLMFDSDDTASTLIDVNFSEYVAINPQTGDNSFDSLIILLLSMLLSLLILSAFAFKGIRPPAVSQNS